MTDYPQGKRDRGHTMWAGRTHYVFNVGVSDHDALQRGVTATKVTQVALSRETGEPQEYWEAKQTAALFAQGRHGGMPTFVDPHYQED